MRHRLREDGDASGFAHDLPNVFLVLLIAPHFLWAGEVAFVTAGDDDQPPIAGVHIGELECRDGQSTVYPAVAVDVILVGVKTGPR